MADTSQQELLTRTARYLDYFQALNEVAKSLTSDLQLEAVLNTVMRCLSQLLKPKHWSLLMYDAKTQELTFHVTVGDAADKLRGLRLKLGEGIAGWVAKHQEGVAVPRVADDPRFLRRMDDATEFQTSSILCVPLVCRGQLLGVIELVKDQHDPHPYGAEDLEILGPIADFAAIAILNARTFARVEEMTIIDEWTSLYNARYLSRCLTDEVARAQRYNRPLSVLFFDLDNFKQVNDSHGHSTGSGLLRCIGEFLRQIARETDRAVRYGGDEFVLVMPETDKAGAALVAERIRSELAAAKFSLPNAPNVGATASFGVASFPADANDGAALLEAADRAMYISKAMGRNKVTDAAQLPR